MHRPERGTVGKWVLIAVLMPATAVLVALTLRNPTPSEAAAAALPFAATQALVISGGSLTEPVVERAGTSIDWQVEAAVHEAAGIGRAPVGEKPLAVAVREDPIDASVSMIVVQGGEADTATPQRELEVATYHLLDWLVAYKPADAIVVLAGPIPPPGTPSAELLRVNHTLRFAARQRQVRYLDAFELKWTSDQDLSTELGGQLVAAQAPRTFASPLPEVSPSPSPTPSLTPSPSPAPSPSP